MQYAIEMKAEEKTPGKQTAGMDYGIQLEDHERTRCEVWTRVMGYHRPVSAFNHGKKAEHAERVCFTEAC
jgi:hypothetical protein